MTIEEIARAVAFEWQMSFDGVYLDFAKEVAMRAAVVEREACAKSCEAEYVDALGSGCEEDFAYNNALDHAAGAIRARSNAGA